MVGFIGTHAMCGLSGSALAYKSKDPCKGKTLPDALAESLIHPLASARGIAGQYRYHGDAIAAVHRDFQATIEANFLAMPRTAINPLLQQLDRVPRSGVTQ